MCRSVTNNITKRLVSIIATVCAMVYSVSAMAQKRSDFEQEVCVGISGGANMSQVRFLHNSTAYTSLIGDQNMFNHPGLTFGASVLYIAQKHFGVVVDLNWTQKGWTEKFEAKKGETQRLVGAGEKLDFNGVELRRDLTYIDIPILAHLYFGRKVRWYINFGPQLSFLCGEKDKQKISPEQLDVLGWKDARVNQGIPTHWFDLALAASTGIDLHFRHLSGMLECRWTYGLHDLYPHSKSDLFQRSNTQNLAFVMRIYVPVKKFKCN